MYMQCRTAIAIKIVLIFIDLLPFSLFCEINFNILPSLCSFSKRSVRFMFSHQNLVGIFLLPHVCYFLRPSYPP